MLTLACSSGKPTSPNRRNLRDRSKSEGKRKPRNAETPSHLWHLNLPFSRKLSIIWYLMWPLLFLFSALFSFTHMLLFLSAVLAVPSFLALLQSVLCACVVFIWWICLGFLVAHETRLRSFPFRLRSSPLLLALLQHSFYPPRSILYKVKIRCILFALWRWHSSTESLFGHFSEFQIQLPSTTA